MSVTYSPSLFRSFQAKITLNPLLGPHMDLAAHFGDAVRQHRQLIRLSQVDLADRAGLDRTYVSGIERCTRNPSLKNLQKIADALGSDLDVLFATARELSTKSERAE